MFAAVKHLQLYRVATHLEIREFRGKNCWWKMKLFCKCLRKFWHHTLYFHILSKDKSYQCCFLLYRCQNWVREKHCKTEKSQGIVRENENLKIVATLLYCMVYTWSNDHIGCFRLQNHCSTNVVPPSLGQTQDLKMGSLQSLAWSTI